LSGRALDGGLLGLSPVIPSGPALDYDLQGLALELPSLLGNRAMALLAVGSVGRAFREGRPRGEFAVGDYDLILVARGLGELDRLMCRRRIDRWLRRAEKRYAVPVSV